MQARMNNPALVLPDAMQALQSIVADAGKAPHKTQRVSTLFPPANAAGG